MKDLQEIRLSLDKFVPNNTTKAVTPVQSLAKYLSQNLRSDLSLVEIAALVALIEKIKLDNGTTLGKALEKDGGKTLQSYSDKPIGFKTDTMKFIYSIVNEHISALPSSLSETYNKPFLQTLATIHSTLIEIMEKNLALANSKKSAAPYQLDYPKSRLDSAFPLQRIGTESQKDELSDIATIEEDVKRKLITFSVGKKTENGSLKFTPFVSSKKSVIEKIEEFTGDKVSVKGSKANKIFNFGGQFLHAELLNEFAFATELNGKKIIPMKNEGTVKWRRMPDGKIEGEVVVELFSISANDKLNVLNTEGTGLVEFVTSGNRDDEKRGTKILSGLSEHPRHRTPIGSIRVTLELVGEENNYTIKPKKSIIRYNTNELKCIRGSRELQSIITYLHKADINDNEMVKHSIHLLLSLSKDEWAALKKSILPRQHTLKTKIAEIFAKGQLHNLIEISGSETSLLKKQLILLYGKSNFEYDLDIAHKKFNPNIDKMISKLTQAFQKLKTNSSNLCLQDFTDIVAEIMKSEPIQADAKSTLQYILNEVNTRGLTLTTHDLEKIAALKKMVEAIYPKDHGVTKNITILLDSLYHLNLAQPFTSEPIKSDDKKLNEIPFNLTDKNFAKQVLLVTKAMIQLRKIHRARETISTQLTHLSKPFEIEALKKLNTDLEKIHTRIVEHIQARAVTPEFLKQQRTQTTHAIDRANYADSSSTPLFGNTIESVKATLELAGEKNNYTFKPSKSISTNELQGRKESQKPPSIIQDLQKADINDNKVVKHSIQQLQSLSKEEWAALKDHIGSTSHGDLKTKIAEIFFKGQMLNFIEIKGGETSFLKKQLASLYDKPSFESYLKDAHKLTIDTQVTKFTQFFQKLKTNSSSLCLQDFIGIVAEIMKSEPTETDALSKLRYILNEVNTRGLTLTTHDLEKITALKKMVDAIYPKDHEVTKNMTILLDSLDHLNRVKPFTSEPIKSDDKKLNEITFKATDKNFAKQVLLVTEAMIHLRKIHHARETISTQRTHLSKPVEIEALDALKTDLDTVHTRIVRHIQARAVSPQFLIQQMKQTTHAIDRASLADQSPTSLFGKIIESIKSIFVSKRPSIADALKDVKPDLPTKLTQDYTKLRM